MRSAAVYSGHRYARETDSVDSDETRFERGPPRLEGE
jgi:hypothetical protein